MGKGKRYELETKNNINESTDSSVKAHRPDFSGNSTGEVADVMVLWQEDRYEPQRPSGHPERKVVYLELKKRGGVKEGNRKTVFNGSSEGQNGLEEVRELYYESPPWSDQYVVIKFRNRKPIVLEVTNLLHYLLRDEWEWSEYDDGINYHGARLTPSGNISMVKPTLDEWESTQSAAKDHIEILKAIGVEKYYIENETNKSAST
jgi:hypothetical protein